MPGTSIGVLGHAVRLSSLATGGNHIACFSVNINHPLEYLAHLQSAGVSYLFCGNNKIDLHIALRKLSRAFHVRKLMLQGGGKFNGAMLRAGLVDEVSHITVPVADGGVGISSFFDIPGKPPPKAAATLRLLSHKLLPGGVTWSRYRVVAKPLS